MKIRPVSAALAYDGRHTMRGKRVGPRVSHLLVVMSDGQIFERFSDMPAGEWGIVDGPPKRQKAKRKK